MGSTVHHGVGRANTNVAATLMQLQDETLAFERTEFSVALIVQHHPKCFPTMLTRQFARFVEMVFAISVMHHPFEYQSCVVSIFRFFEFLENFGQ